MDPTPIERRDFDAAALAHDFPPKLRHANKKLVHRLSCPTGCEHRGALGFSRWRELPVPDAVPPDMTAVEPRAGFFDYAPEPAGVVGWHLNFADRNLFGAYGGPLLAQDELQVLEHPALGSLREALPKAGLKPLTVEDGRPTPCLVTGVERRCALDTTHLYGNRFARADAATVERATRVLAPPTITNVLAIEAPPGGVGKYRRDELDFVLATAFTGFFVAKLESARRWPGAAVAIHTGFWGCGAYGGNRIVMTLLQLLAARLARVERLVFHARAEELATFEAARATLERIAQPSVARLLGALEARGFTWGESDGT